MSEQDPGSTPEPQLSYAKQLQERRGAKERLWRSGELSWKFEEYPWCEGFYRFIRENWGEQIWILAHRRSGKSTTGLVIALEECIRVPYTSVAVVCKSNLQARDICNLSFAALLDDCPKSVRPRLVKNEFAYEFPNGSKIQILPADGLHGTKSRGRRFRFILITEGAFIPRLENLIKSVLGPTLLDVTGKTQGMMVIESTPPTEEVAGEDAEYYEEEWHKAELEGRAYSLPLSKNEKASQVFKDACVKQAGGVETLYYKREFEIQFLREDNRTAIPEATLARLREGDPVKGLPPIVREVTRPNGADRYTSLDPGGTHKTALLWGFYDFENDLLCIQDETTFDNMTTDTLAETVREKEKALWGDNPDGKLLRISDNNNQILLYDLHREHSLVFYSTAKDHKFAQINRIRMMVRDGQLAIDPRCKLLEKTLTLAKFKKHEQHGFSESKEIGHADLLDALIYMARNIRRRELPEPVKRRAAEEGLPQAHKPQTTKSAQGFASFLKRLKKRHN